MRIRSTPRRPGCRARGGSLPEYTGARDAVSTDVRDTGYGDPRAGATAGLAAAEPPGRAFAAHVTEAEPGRSARRCAGAAPIRAIAPVCALTQVSRFIHIRCRRSRQSALWG